MNTALVFLSALNSVLLVIILLKITELLKMNAVVSTNVQQAVDEMTAAVAAETPLDASVRTFVNSVPGLIAAAVAKASAAGATPAQLAAFDTLSQTMTANAATVSAALVANTPAA